MIKKNANYLNYLVVTFFMTLKYFIFELKFKCIENGILQLIEYWYFLKIWNSWKHIFVAVNCLIYINGVNKRNAEKIGKTINHVDDDCNGRWKNIHSKDEFNCE